MSLKIDICCVTGHIYNYYARKVSSVLILLNFIYINMIRNFPKHTKLIAVNFCHFFRHISDF